MGFRTADLLDRAPVSPHATTLPAGCGDVIFSFDDVTWDAAQKRGMCFPEDRVALALLEEQSLRRVMICNIPRSAPVRLVKDLVRPPAHFEESERAHLHQPLRARRRDPVTVGGLGRHYAAYGRRLRRAAERFGLERPAVITAQPFVAGFAELDWAGPVTLLATDHLASHPAYRRWRKGLEAAYEETARRRRRVCAVTQAIIDRIEPQGPWKVVPNGVDRDEWLAPAEPPRWMTERPGPRLLYIGALDDRLDTEAISALARTYTQGTILLVGPLVDRGRLLPLLGEPNVVHHGAVSRSAVASLVHGADVCLMPHVRSAVTESMSPLKLYEYLAGGAPTVATDLEPVRRVEGPVVRIAPGGDFVAGVRTALAEGRRGEAERRAFIERNSWDRRCSEVLALALAR